MGARQSSVEPVCNTPYKYTPLNNSGQHLRLLTIEPGTGTVPVKCSLHPVDLQDNPTYETISYCWGEASIRQNLILDGHSFSAPASSVGALRRMRLKDRSRTLWIDSICIDQSNIPERNHQVAMMKDVYSRSQGNLIYLGEPDGTEKKAIAGLNAIFEEAMAETQRTKKSLRELFFDVSLHLHAELKSKVHVDAICALLSRPWFSRVWIIQEAVLVPKNLCICGSFEIPLIKLLIAATYMSQRVDPDLIKSCNFKAHEMLLFVVDRDEEFIRPRSQHLNLMIGILTFPMMGNMHSTDARDRVYGMLGLYHPSETSLQNSIKVEYTNPLAQVMRDATWVALAECRDTLDIVLEEVNHRTREEVIAENWPSWVPRWERPIDYNADSLNYSEGRAFNACAKTSIPWDLLNKARDSDVLSAIGFRIGVVQERSRELRPEIILDHNELLAWLTEAQKIAAVPVEVLGEILVVGSGYPGDLESEEFSNGAALSALVDHLRSKEILPVSDELRDKALYWFYLYLATRSRCRVVFGTGSGYFGCGPKVMDEGDVVVVLHGCRLPCVLRKYGGKYKFLGVCYVHGIMDGVAFHAHRVSGEPDEVFEIC